MFQVRTRRSSVLRLGWIYSLHTWWDLTDLFMQREGKAELQVISNLSVEVVAANYMPLSYLVILGTADGSKLYMVKMCCERANCCQKKSI